MTRQLIAKFLIAVPAVLCALAGPALADEAKGAPKADAKPAFRVCGDPSNLPFSNEKREGIENKIADVIAKDLGLPLEYTWWPHQRGVVKRVLNTGRCDVMLGIPKGYDPVLWTRPYYRTGYAMAYRKDRGLKLHSLDDPQLKTLKIGVQVNTPPHEALAQHGIPADNIVGYQLMFDSNFHAEDYPGKEIEELIAGQIDVALVWGPIAGYFAKKKGAPIEVVLLEEPAAGSPFAFDISMGVKKNNKELKARLEDSIARKRGEITRILEEFGVPLLPVVEGKTTDKGKP
jgi:mxaJ protein